MTDSEAVLVIKIGGSTLGADDTTLRDVVGLQRAGVPVVVVHGGGPAVTAWMDRQGVEARFVRGLRVTDEPSLEIAVAVLAGLVNKQLVAELNALGGRAAGICGADGPTVLAEVTDAEYGRVGQVREIRTALLKSLLAAGFVPVISPVGIEVRASPDPLPHEGARTNGASSNGAAAEEGKALTGEAVASDDLPALVGRGQAVGGLLNINADSVAGEIAAALGATRLIFLTDVPGVKDAGGAFVTALDADECEALIQSGAIGGGMIPKVEACVRAADAGVVAMIVDGREADALQRVLDGSANGTRIG